MARRDRVFFFLSSLLLFFSLMCDMSNQGARRGKGSRFLFGLKEIDRPKRRKSGEFECRYIYIYACV